MPDTQDIIIQETPLAPAVPTAAGQVNLIGLSRQELENTIVGFGLPKFRAKQIFHWLYHRGAKSFDEMTTLSKRAREQSSERCIIARPSVVNEQLSEDRTRKWLLGVHGGGEVERAMDVNSF